MRLSYKTQNKMIDLPEYTEDTLFQLLKQLLVLLTKQIKMVFNGSFTLFEIFETKRQPQPRVEYTEVIDFCKSNEITQLSFLKYTDLHLGFSIEKAFIVVTDIIGSTRMYNENPLRTKQKIDAHDVIVKMLAKKNKGHIVANEGDSFHIVFEFADHAIEFCKSFKKFLDREDILLKVRMGINKGPMISRNFCGYKCYGKPVDETVEFIKHNEGNKICIKSRLMQKYNIPDNHIFCKH